MMQNNIKVLRSNFKIITYFIKSASKISRSYIPLLITTSVLKSIVPFVNIIMPKFIIDELGGEKRLHLLFAMVFITISLNFILNFIIKKADYINSIKNLEILNSFELQISETIMNMDFEKLEDPKVLDLKEQAIFPLKNQNVINRMLTGIMDILVNIITLLCLFGLIASLNFYVPLVILLIICLNIALNKKSQKIQHEFYKKVIPINRKNIYFGKLVSDFSTGKDIRLYNISPLIMDKIKHNDDLSVSYGKKIFGKIGIFEGVNMINLELQNFLIYLYLVFKVLYSNLSIGSFTMYVNATTKFSSCISNTLKTFIELSQMCRYLDPYFNLKNIKTHNKIGDKKIDPSDYTIEFKNVSFKYPRQDSYALKNISIKISKGTKLSIVGLNGAGKTTFIKLLSRLYQPTEGSILLNNRDIRDYDYDDYTKFLSVVFQDFKLFACSIKENLSFSNEGLSDQTLMDEALAKIGLQDDILKLPEKHDTHLFKIFNSSGIELSGGQSQKLAISRALLKNGGIFILDEPTAALDPISEFEIYSKFNQLTLDKTVIYISHRLSSCKFCDVVAVFAHGEIIQYGNHSELILQNEGLYYKMFKAQSKYYV